ncbi:hypothetical protein HWV62_24924 [Athelia sp. TMB]|nr:hypothetical protein HWV62_24924 [Athelia sp. TMB]
MSTKRNKEPTSALNEQNPSCTHGLCNCDACKLNHVASTRDKRSSVHVSTGPVPHHAPLTTSSSTQAHPSTSYAPTLQRPDLRAEEARSARQAEQAVWRVKQALEEARQAVQADLRREQEAQPEEARRARQAMQDEVKRLWDARMAELAKDEAAVVMQHTVLDSTAEDEKRAGPAAQAAPQIQQAQEEARRVMQAELRRIRKAQQEEAKRAQQAEQEAMMVELAKEEAAVTVQHIVLDFTVVTFSAGLAVESVLSGFESCRVTAKNLPADATIKEVHQLVSWQGIEPEHFYIAGLRGTSSAKQEADLISHNFLRMDTMVHILFRGEQLKFETLDHGRGDGMSASTLDPNVLTLTWRGPSAPFLVTYESAVEANAKVRALDRKVFLGKRVKVEVNRQQNCFSVGAEVLIRNLPPDASDDDVKRFAGCDHIERRSFCDFDVDQVPGHILRYIASIPGVQLIRLENVVVDSVGGTYSVRAHFGSWAQTRDVHNQCNKRRFPFIGNSAFLWLRLPDPIEYNITIPISQYRAQEKERDALVKSIKDEDGRKLTIVPRDRVSVIRVGGEDKKAVGSLKVRVESIAAGEKVDGWHSSLSQRFADRVLRDTGAFLRIDRRLRALKVFGEPGSIAAARAIVDTELAHLESLEQIVLLKRQSIRFFVTRGLAMLKAELGEDNAALDVSSAPPKVIIRGGEAARHTLNRLISESLDTANTACGDVNEATCPICYDAITLPIKLGCGHAYCSACIRHFLASASSFPLVCMGDEDKCHIPIPIPVIQRFLPVQQYTNLLEQAFITYVDRHPEDFKYCTTADCRQIYRCDKSKRGTIVHCPACLSSVCAACHEEGHEGMTCAERKLQNDPEEEERLNEQLAREAGFKKCPRCSVWIEKTEGCNHMECRCGAHLCWVCMEVFDAQSVYPHMSSAHGGFHDVNARQVNQLYQQDYFAEQQEALHLAALRDQEALRQAAARREQREDVRVRHAQRAGEDVMRRQRRHEFGHIYEYTTPEEALREHEILRLQQARRRHEIREEALRQEEGGPGSFFGGLVQVLAFMGALYYMML